MGPIVTWEKQIFMKMSFMVYLEAMDEQTIDSYTQAAEDSDPDPQSPGELCTLTSLEMQLQTESTA
jgi:hypothetical protein